MKLCPLERFLLDVFWYVFHVACATHKYQETLGLTIRMYFKHRVYFMIFTFFMCNKLIIIIIV